MRNRAPVPTPDLTQERDAAAIAIEQAFGQMNAMGDLLVHWRLRTLEQAIIALDNGEYRNALDMVERALVAVEQISAGDWAEAARLRRAIEIEHLMAMLTETPAGRAIGCMAPAVEAQPAPRRGGRGLRRPQLS